MNIIHLHSRIFKHVIYEPCEDAHLILFDTKEDIQTV